MDLQSIVIISTTAIFVLSGLLSILLTLRYSKLKSKNYLFWSIGMWLFTFGVILESIFALKIYNEFLIDLYLAVVALLVEFLALGSVQFLGKKVKSIYYVYSVFTSLALIISFMFVKIGNIISNYVVFGLLPLITTVISSIITFPAALIIIISAYLTIRRSKQYKDQKIRRHKVEQMVSIIIGVIVVSIAGTLYIAAYPEVLYWAEFFGILLLWLGFI